MHVGDGYTFLSLCANVFGVVFNTCPHIGCGIRKNAFFVYTFQKFVYWRICFLFLVFQAARGQAPDLILADEICFVGQGALLGIIPIMSVEGRKQVHISSHQAKSWANEVSGIIDKKTGKSAYHVIDQRFKCLAHAHLKSLTCPCKVVFCPSHINLNSSLQALTNLIAPGGDIELTGGGDHVEEEKSDKIFPFSDEINKILLNNEVDLNKNIDEITNFFICIDPTFSTGSQSSVGVCTLAQTSSGTFVIMALDEVNVNGINLAYLNFYSCLLMAHIKLANDFRKKNQNVIFVPEANTFPADNQMLYSNLKNQTFLNFGFSLKAYYQKKKTNNTWDLGRLVQANKHQMVMGMRTSITQFHLARNSVIFSFGNIIKNAFLKQKELLNKKYRISESLPSEAGSKYFYHGIPNQQIDIEEMDPHECVDHIFKYLGGIDIFIKSFQREMIDEGLQKLNILIEEMKQIALKRTANGLLRVYTGGKKKKGHEYTRDDLFSAVLVGATLTYEQHCPKTWCSEWLVTDESIYNIAGK